MPKYIGHFPKPLLDDLVAGRWLPVVGAGMSRNAVVSSGKQVPLWDDLGRQLSTELQDYPYAGALDAISAYAHEYGRPRLVERVAEALMITDARPGDPHRAFCSILFDIVCTTNLDFLLERQYESLPHRHYRPVIDEDNLVVNAGDETTLLLKLHGDVHHPTRLVLTEEDYDGFLDRYPLLATYLANLLITRTAVLIGYSLDDPDFRQVWHVVGERLGRARRLAYAILVDAKPTEIARFARRGVKVINVPGSRSRYSQILAAVFDELREYVQTNLLDASHVTEEEPLTEFSLPKDAATRLCFFAVPLALQPQYRDQVFPLAERAGLVPVTSDDVISPGENYAAKTDAMIRRAVAAVVDATTHMTLVEMGMISNVLQPERIAVIVAEGGALPSDIAAVPAFMRGRGPIAEQSQFLAQLDTWFRQVSVWITPALAHEPRRLLSAREYRAAVVSAMTYFESLLRQNVRDLPGRAFSLGQLVEAAAQRGIFFAAEQKVIRDWIRVRNSVVHSVEEVSKSKATEIVNGVLSVAERLSPSEATNGVKTGG